MFDTSKYTIGWICALPLELNAARVFLDAEHDKSDFVSAAKDDNAYIFGSIGRHNVVIATLPRGEYGTNSAASVARDLIRSFTDVRVALMVGIGGGAPLMEPGHKIKRDIRLGDVVVSVPGDGKPGVIQYDLGRNVQGKEFQMTGSMDKPPKSLLTALDIILSDYEMGNIAIDEDVSEALSKRPAKFRKANSRPDAERDPDRLHVSTFVFSDDATATEGDIVHRPARPDDEDPVLIHTGLIASGNSVMKDALLRNTFALDQGVLCFEMEAAGLMDQFGFLVIRGICDYSDSHKSKGWQGYAAMTAAVFARKLLLQLSPAKVEEEKKMVEALQDVMSKIDNVDKKITHQNKEGHRKDMEAWLTAPDPSTNHNAACRLRHSNTGEWILADETFQAWCKNDFSLLWLHGISGCGKTVLSSTLIEHLKFQQIENRRVVLYFYFDTQDSRKRTLDDCLRSLIVALCSAEPRLWSHLGTLYEACVRDRSQPKRDAMQECFVRMCSEEPVTVVMDALDESPEDEHERHDILRWLNEMNTPESKIKFLVTSRPEQDIKETMDEIQACQSIAIEGQSVDADIQAYIRSCIHDPNGRLKKFGGMEEAQKQIETKLVEKAEGMFRWVNCQFDALEKCTSRGKLRETLENLPKGLFATYDRILANIPQENRREAVAILQFLLYSPKVLSTEEMVDVIAVRPETEPAFDTENRVLHPRYLTSFCSSLTRIVQRDQGRATIDELQLAHASVKEYLLLLDRTQNIFRAELGRSHASACMVQICLSYLFSSLQTGSDVLKPNILPFELSASEISMGIAKHAESGGESALEWIWKAYTVPEFYRYWLEMHSYRSSGKYQHDELFFGNHTPSIRSSKADMYLRQAWPRPLYHATMLDLTQTARRLLRAGADVNAPNKDDAFHYNTCGVLRATALFAACGSGHVDMARLLLDHGANIHAVNDFAGNAFEFACVCGTAEIVELLLERGAIFDASNPASTAFYNACKWGEPEVLKLLLDKGVDVNAQTGGGANALPYACQDEIQNVKILLERGADVNAGRDDLGRNSLQCACYLPNLDVVRLLLANDVNVNAKGGERYGTALQVAIEIGDYKLMRLLLNHGAKIVIQQLTGTALETAVKRLSTEAEQILLNHEASIGLPIDAFARAITLALKQEYPEYPDRPGSLHVILLVDKMCSEIDQSTDVLGRARLHIWAAYACGDQAETLPRFATDIDATDHDGWTALHWAAYFNKHDTIRTLLRNGANDTTVDWQGWTAQQLAVAVGNLHCAALLRVSEDSGDVRVSDAKSKKRDAFCDFCGHKLRGMPYDHCAECHDPGYDLCFRCKRHADAIHPEHKFIAHFRRGMKVPATSESDQNDGESTDSSVSPAIHSTGGQIGDGESSDSDCSLSRLENPRHRMNQWARWMAREADDRRAKQKVTSASDWPLSWKKVYWYGRSLEVYT